MLKKMFRGFGAVIAFVTLFASVSFAETVKTLSFFEDSVVVEVTFPKELKAGSKDNTFIIQVKDAEGNPWREMTSEWSKFSIEMPEMHHGVQEVKDVKDLLDANDEFQGRIAVTPKFPMKDMWQLNITLISTTTETKSVQFRVN